jgi:hypothetical protein
MNINEIKKLIDAFYNGETNREEEQTLRGYFNGENVAENLREEQTLFRQMFQNDEVEIPPALEQKLSETIDQLSRKELVNDKPIIKKLWIQAISVAASLAILVSIGLFSNKEKANNHETLVAQISEEDKQKVREAEEALLLLSIQFNKGIEQITLVSASLDKTKSIINNSINR